MQMEKAISMLAAMVSAMVLASGVAWAATVRCEGGECRGTTKNDEIQGTDRRDIIYGLKGRDKLYGNLGRDDLYGSDGWDRAEGSAGPDKLSGCRGSDQLVGGEGSDVLSGGYNGTVAGWPWGSDRLWGGEGSDSLNGGPVDDYLRGEGGDATSSAVSISHRTRWTAGPETTTSTEDHSRTSTCSARTGGRTPYPTTVTHLTCTTSPHSTSPRTLSRISLPVRG